MIGILWDMDDTLLNTLPVRMRALAHAHEVCLGTRLLDPEALWRSHRGGSLEAMGQRLMGDDYMRFCTTYRDFYYSQERVVESYPGVEPVLQACLDHGMPMAVVTSKIAFGAIDELAKTGLLRFFGAVVGADDTDLHKPDPEPVYAALERLCYDDPSEFLFVGDSPADIWAARNAGCTSVGALWGTIDRELLLDAMPDHTIKAPGELLALLTEVEAAR